MLKKAHQKGITVASICHGPWMLAKADIIKGVNVTSYSSIASDLKNAGAVYVDKEVVKSNNIITSRTPDDLSVFVKTIIESIN